MTYRQELRCNLSEIMRLRFQHTLADILELNRAAKEQRIKSLLVLLFAAALALVAASWALFDQNQPNAIAALEFAGVFLVLGLAAPWIAGMGAWLFKASRAPYEVEIKPEGVVLIVGTKLIECTWKDFRRWFRTENLLVLVGKGEALAIPKRCCDIVEWKSLGEVVRAGLGDSACC